MSLRDELVERLSAIQVSEGARIAAEFESSGDRPNARAFMGINALLADECLRQMEWAQTLVERCDHDCAGCNSPNHHDGEPLTLAPEGWKP
jgi:hypothetical protein